MTKIDRPVVYISSPYTKGDSGVNVRFQMELFDKLRNDNIVVPIVPLWSHLQHAAFPRSYESWMDYDLAIIPRCDGCLRLASTYAPLNYEQYESPGAERECALFRRLNKPVYTDISAMYNDVRSYRFVASISTSYHIT